jgi:hypothetical protein
MDRIHNKSLMFYSLHPNDQLSRQCLDYLHKNPALAKQFVLFLVHHPQNFAAPPLLRLPARVLECARRGQIPLLAMAGMKDLVFGQAALSWLENSALHQAETVVASNIDGLGTADNCATIAQASRPGNSLFDTDYNIGFDDGRGAFNKDYASLEEAVEARITCYDEIGGSNSKSVAGQEIRKKMDELKASRNQEAVGRRPLMSGPPMGNTPYVPPMMGGGGGGMPMGTGMPMAMPGPYLPSMSPGMRMPAYIPPPHMQQPAPQPAPQYMRQPPPMRNMPYVPPMPTGYR